MLETSVEIGIDLFKDLIFTAWNTTSGFVKEKYAENDPLGIATRSYISRLVQRYDNIRVLGSTEPVPLKSLYVRVNILEKIRARMRLNPKQLAQFFDHDKRAFGTTVEAVDGEIIVNRLQKFIVLGKPGAGKTTYLRFLALMMLDKTSRIERRRLPVFVTLREWTDRRMPLVDFIIDQFDVCGFPKAKPFLEKMLTDGQCLILFDGLDEVSQEANQDDIIRQLCDFTDKYANNQFVISCRVAAYNHWFERFTDVEIADFNEQQMENFIRNWFHEEPKIGADCWNELKSSPPLREMAATPLLLTLLCLEYHESHTFPVNRAELYECAIETLLARWDASRLIRRSEAYKQLSIKRKESMFARIAFFTFLHDEYFIRERQLAKMIEKYLENLPGFNPAELEPDGGAVLRAIEAQHGIFVERAQNIFSFAHLTFQEYFAAKYIVDNHSRPVDEALCSSDDYNRPTLLEELVDRYLNEPKWKEIFLLVAGMLDNADELLLLMRRKADEVLEESEIQALFKAAEEVLLPWEESTKLIGLRRLWAMHRMISTRIQDMLKAKPMEIFKIMYLVNIRDLVQDLGLFIFLYADVIPVQHRDQVWTHLGNRAWAQNINQFPEIFIPTTFEDYVNTDYYDHDDHLEINKAAVEKGFGLDIVKIKDYAQKEEKFSHDYMLTMRKYVLNYIFIIDCLKSSYYTTTTVQEKMIHELFLPR